MPRKRKDSLFARTSGQRCLAANENTHTPIAAPRVLVMRSKVPESRMGRKYCKSSIVRLNAAPRKIAIQCDRGLNRVVKKKALNRRPAGTKAIMFSTTCWKKDRLKRTSFQKGVRS